MRRLWIGGIVAIFAMVMTSCETVAPDTSITAFNFTAPVSGLGIIDEAAKTIDVNVPFGTELNNVVGTVTIPAEATITPDITAGVDFSSLSVDFTVSNGDESSTYTVNVIVGDDPMRLALVGQEATVDEIANDEIKKAYEWALSTYAEKARYIPFSDVDADAISSATLVWFHYHTTWDQDNGEMFSFPADFAGAAAALTTFYKDGGNFLLTTHAIPAIVEMGRVSSDLGPTAVNGNPGIAGDNPDNWGISYQEGFFEAGQYPADNKDNALFAGLTTSDVTFEGVTYPAIFLSAPGDKKDDAVLWDFNVMIDQGVINADKGDVAPNAGANAFEQATNSTIRASFEWDPAANGIELATIIEWNPEGDFGGTAITIGPGAYEWDRVDEDTNTDAYLWDGNVKGLTQNAIDLFVE